MIDELNMVSIIVPVYNGSDYISDFYICCVKQTYSNFEVIFVDDGSTDDSLEKLNKLRETATLNIKVLHQGNQGVSSARNNGLRLAKGEYVCFCDIDDAISSRYLEDMMEVHRSKNVDLVISQMKFIKETDNINSISYESEICNVKILSKMEALEQYLYSKFQAGCCTILLKRSIMIENGIEFPSGYKYNEDIYTLWKVMSYTNNVAIMDKQLYFYKQHSGTAMTKFNYDRLDGLELMKKLEGYFYANNPEFSKKYKKYGAARIAWSLSWQAAIFLDCSDYKQFITKNNLRLYCKQLITYPQLKVAISSFIMLLSPMVFKWLAVYNKPYRYK